MRAKRIDANAARATSAPLSGANGGADLAPRLRVWPALALYLFAALIPEMLSGSTPPLRFLQPFNLVFLPLLYGSSALLIREAIVRRRLGWINVLLLGAAFGVFQEALVVQTWFTYAAPSSASHTANNFSVAHGIDWSAAIGFTLYHAVISVATPLALIQGLLPRQAGRPWLGRKSAIFLGMWLLLPSAAVAVRVAVSIFSAEGYHGPPEPQYAYAALAVLALVALGLLVRVPRLPDSPRPAPTVRRVFLSAAGLTLLFFITQLPLGAAPAAAAIPIGMTVAVCAWALWRVWTWSARAGWSAAQEFALALGVVAFFAFVLDPIEEFYTHTPLSRGLTGASWLVFAALALVNVRLMLRGQRARRGAGAAPLPGGAPLVEHEAEDVTEDGEALQEEAAALVEAE
ncbi:MAG TPA: hypothetical protein VF808_00205 [Ktedonobacterales bacterium]